MQIEFNSTRTKLQQRFLSTLRNNEQLEVALRFALLVLYHVRMFSSNLNRLEQFTLAAYGPLDACRAAFNAVRLD